MAHRVLGTDETVGAMTRDSMLAYFKDRYSADNTVAALAGRLDFDAMVEQIAAQSDHWKQTQTQRAYPATQLVDKTFTIDSETVNRHYILMLAPAPASDDDRRYAAGMLSQILGDVEGSRLYWALIETGLAEEAAAQYDGHDGLGNHLVYAVCSPEQAQEVEQALCQEIDKLCDSLTQDDLERTRSKVATAVTLAGELPSGRMRRLGRLTTYGLTYRTLEEELERINAVTLDDLRQTYDAFPMQPIVTGRLAP
jgi:predicted Zn-dependent peptidase